MSERDDLLPIIVERIGQGADVETVQRDLEAQGYSIYDINLVLQGVLEDIEDAYQRAEANAPEVAVDPQTKKQAWYALGGMIGVGVVLISGIALIVYLLQDDPVVVDESYAVFVLQEEEVERGGSTDVDMQATSTEDSQIPQEEVAEEIDTKPETEVTAVDVASLLHCLERVHTAALTAEDIQVLKNEVERATEEMLLQTPTSANRVCLIHLISAQKAEFAFQSYVAGIDVLYDVTFFELTLAAQRAIIAEYEEKRANEHAKKAAIVNILNGVRPEVLLCLDGSGSFSNPADGVQICESRTALWPELTAHGVSWGGCSVTQNAEAYEFRYCVTFSDGELVECTESACVKE